MRVSIVGTGYVGLVTGACLAAKGHEVVCVDIDAARVEALNAARSPIYEPGLDELLVKHVGHQLRATTDLPAAVIGSEVTFIAVGTPFDGKAISLTAVIGAAREIGAALRKKDSYHVVVVKSTVVPGTTDHDVLPTLEEGSGKVAGRDFGVGMNPEFLSEGEAIQDFMHPDRIVLGGIDARSIDVLEELYRPFPESPRIRTTPATAEMIKYASNALLATLISFTNELANLGTALGGIDSTDVMRAVHLSQYFVGRNAESLPPITGFLRAGCGFGGSCLPKDVKALIAHGQQCGQEMPILRSVIRTNETQPLRVTDILRKHWHDLRGVRVTVLGLSFKPKTNDVRESPAFPIIHDLSRNGAVLCAYDPVAMEEARPALPASVTLAHDLSAALDETDAIVVVTPWDEFLQVPDMLRARKSNAIFVDCRRVFAKDAVPRYEGIGL